MNRSILAGATLAALVALAGCGSDDDDDPPPEVDETSMAGPDRELSSEPGGDTSAIAGYWDASLPELGPETRYVLITENGLETSYERQTSDVDESVNCYSRAGPQTLTPGEGDAYELDDGTRFTAVRGEGDDADTLTVTREPDLVESWSLVEGRVPEDLPLCGPEEEEIDPADGEVTLPVEGGQEEGPGDTSMLNPDAPATPPSADPSGNDTGAIAGLWDATGGPEGRVDQRYVLISDDGLWTDYDFRQDDLGAEGNCYFVTPLRLDLETGDAASGSYSIADGRSFDVVDAGADGTLDLSFGEGVGDVTWSRAEGLSAADLEACDAG